MLKSVENSSKEERIERLKGVLTMVGSNLILDGDYLMRIWSLANDYYGLEDLKLSEVKEIIKEVHDAEVNEIAEWSLQFTDVQLRDEKIAEKVIERQGMYDYKVVAEIGIKAERLSSEG